MHKMLYISEVDLARSAPTRSATTVLMCVVEQTRDLWRSNGRGPPGSVPRPSRPPLPPGRSGTGKPDDPGCWTVSEKGGVREVILATNPTTEGDATASIWQKAIGRPPRSPASRAASPPAAHLEYSDRTVVGDALSGRREF